MEIKKVTRKDLLIHKGKVEVDFIKVDGKKINLTIVPHQNIENYITHDNCSDCGIEFKKRFTYDKLCFSCMWKDERKRYQALESVEWDFKTPLCIFEDDTYFNHVDDILYYCYEHETKPSELMLVVCRTTNFSTIDYDHWCDEVHDDWEPSSAFEKKLKEFNEFLENESTNTYWATNKRVDLSALGLDEMMEG